MVGINIPIADCAGNALTSKPVADRTSVFNCGTRSIDACGAANQRVNRRRNRSHPNLVASQTRAAAPRKLFGYAQTETHGLTRSVQISVQGSADPRNSYERSPRF